MTAHPHARRWTLAIALDPASELPLYLQIAHAISADIRAGRLTLGDALPGSRTLAHTLGVHRNTVLAAYTELVTEGWVRTEVAGGTFVSAQPPTGKRGSLPGAQQGVPSEPGFDVDAPTTFENPPAYEPDTLILAKGAPDVRMLPLIPLARAYRRVLTRSGRQLLTYGDPRGLRELRSALATMLSESRGIHANVDAIMITRGSQMAIDLAARALVTPGDAVIVESLGHRPAWNAFRLAGARLFAAPVDEHGLSIDAVESIAATERVRAIYVTPHHQFPTTTVMPPARRAQLLELARRHRIAIIEDDYDYEFHYDGRPVLPLASADTSGVVVYVGTLSKILTPGLRIGFVVAPPMVIDAMTSVRVTADLQGDLAVESAVSELFATGELDRHVRRVRRAYNSRRDALVRALHHELGAALSFEVPSGGMALWARVADDIDIDEWAHHALAHRVAFRGGRLYDFKGESQPYTRLGFSFHDEAELAESARRMAAALADLQTRSIH
ncbi:MAG: PLP-dependent aminotransferase family protein [Gemmatimonadota bacterium]|nr:PLP-dependent aminotransferase family protein [Gemmatimonadota bacterium]